MKLINTVLYDCATWGPGAMIYMPRTVESEVELIDSTIAKCKVCKWDGNNAPWWSYDALVKARCLSKFTCSGNVFEWSPNKGQHNWRTTCLFDLSFLETPDFVMKDCRVQNGTFSEGLVVLRNATQSITYNNVTFVYVTCGNETRERGFLPHIDSDESVQNVVVTLTDCLWERDAELLYFCAATDAFLRIDAGVFKVVLNECHFGYCKSNTTQYAFIDIRGPNEEDITHCTFSHVNNEVEDAGDLLKIASIGKAFINDTSFYLPRISSAHLSLGFDAGDFTFDGCTFVVDGEAEDSQISLKGSDFSFYGCEFNVTNVNTSSTIRQPMVRFTGGGDGSEILFYNCCFSHDVAANDGTLPFYLDLVDHGSVRFQAGVCFDVPQGQAIQQSGGFKIIYDDGTNTSIFGDCQCNVQLDDETYDSLVTEPPSDSETTTDDGGKQVNVGLITGIVFGLLIIIILLVLIILFLLWRRNRKESSSTEAPPQEDQPEETMTAEAIDAADDGFEGQTNDNPLFATELTTNDVFTNEFEEKGSFFMNGQ